MRHRFSHIVIVCNPIAGRGRARAVGEALAARLREGGAECELHLTTARGDGRDHVCARLERDTERARPDCFVAIGGDGTVREVMAGIGERGVPLAIVPCGTANVMSLDFGLPRDAAGAARMIAAGRTHALDTSVVNGELSFLVTGVGFDAEVVRAVEARRRGPISKATWIAPAIACLARYSAPRLQVELDGRAWREPVNWVIASNIVHYGGFRVFASDRAVDDGLLEVYLVRAPSRAALIGCLVRGLVRGWPGGSVRRERAAKVRVVADVPVLYQVDGDARESTPVEIEVRTRSHELIVPQTWGS